MSTVRHHVKVEFFGYADNGFYTVYAPYLKLYGYGKLRSEAIEDLKENIKLFGIIETNKGTLAKTLKKLGWTSVRDDIFSPPNSINLPSNLLKDKKKYRRFEETMKMPFQMAV